MTVIGWLFFGLVVGLLGKLVMPGQDPGGLLGTIAIGAMGSVVGGYVGRLVGLYGDEDRVGFVMAVIGAVIFLAFYRWIVGRTTRGPMPLYRRL